MELESQAGEFGSILTGAKGPAARSLEAAQAYGNIAEAMREAEQRAEEARNDAEESRTITHHAHFCLNPCENAGSILIAVAAQDRSTMSHDHDQYTEAEVFLGMKALMRCFELLPYFPLLECKFQNKTCKEPMTQ